MKKILTLALGLTAITGCSWYDADFDEGWDYGTIDTAYYSAPAEFARGDALADQATLWGETEGFALGNDRFGAVGMVGMVCSFATNDGFLRMDMDPDEGDELVVDAVANPTNDSFSTLSVDGGQITVTDFPSEWEGIITVDVTTPDHPEDAALTDDHIVVVQQGEDCTVEFRSRDSGSILATHSLEGECMSEVATSPRGTVFLATSTGTWGLDVDGSVTNMGEPAHLLSWSEDHQLLFKGDRDTRSVSAFDTTVRWRTELEAGTLVSLETIKGDRLVAGLSGLTQGALVVLDIGSGDVLEDIRTTSTFSSFTVSPQGGMLAVRSPTALHLVRVSE